MQEIKQVNDQLWQLLHDIECLCARPNSVRLHAHRLVEMLEQAQDELAMHFALEDYYGYFENPVRVPLELAERAESLRAEHGGFYRQISQLADRAEVLWCNGQIERLVDCVPLRFNAFHDQLKQHESREDDLILNVLSENQDLFETLQLSDGVEVVDWAVKSLPRYRLDDGFHFRVLAEIESVTAAGA